mmetsp:Transcript_50690/g.151678  ORF Transcript_50690/g.151678 Transcript_50690/m.151678 type:complete len:358 (-) Transcript_50690:257-1330(-)
MRMQARLRPRPGIVALRAVLSSGQKQASGRRRRVGRQLQAMQLLAEQAAAHLVVLGLRELEDPAARLLKASEHQADDGGVRAGPLTDGATHVVPVLQVQHGHVFAGVRPGGNGQPGGGHASQEVPVLSGGQGRPSDAAPSGVGVRHGETAELPLGLDRGLRRPSLGAVERCAERRLHIQDVPPAQMHERGLGGPEALHRRLYVGGEVQVVVVEVHDDLAGGVLADREVPLLPNAEALGHEDTLAVRTPLIPEEGRRGLPGVHDDELLVHVRLRVEAEPELRMEAVALVHRGDDHGDPPPHPRPGAVAGHGPPARVAPRHLLALRLCTVLPPAPDATALGEGVPSLLGGDLLSSGFLD